MLRIESRYKDAYNNSLINTERQATLPKKEIYYEKAKDKQL
jgi:hypothetical protein